MSSTAGLKLTIVVQKFGGSSLATPELRAAALARVKEAIARGMRPVVVASAMGRHPSPYATDTLLNLVRGAQDGQNRDLLLACGEIISATTFAELLEGEGVPARALTGGQAGIVTDDSHGNARIRRVDPRPLRTLLEAGLVPVVAGFQGVTEDGSVTTLGRGSSDLTAVALARALGRAQLDIYTDVDGVMTADPRRVPDAHTIETLDFQEVSELAAHGAKVINDKAAEFARLSRTPFSVKGLASGAGTDVVEATGADPDAPVTGIATILEYTFIHVVPEAAAMPGGWEQECFRILAEAGISLDCINVNAAGVFFIVPDADLESAREKLDALPVAVRARRDCAKISIVGAGMRGTPGVMYRVVRALVDAGVPIIHSTDSNVTISVLVPGSLAATAERALHDYFGLSR